MSVIWSLLIFNAYSISIDCPNIINLARGLGMVTQQPTIWTQLQTDCCTANGVGCVSQRATGIYWNNMNLNGSINQTALPSGLQQIYLDNNQLTGFVPSLFPSALQLLYLYHNELTGSIPSQWPDGLQQLNLGDNLFNGSVPSQWPNSLQFQLTGPLPNTWPGGLQQLNLGNNQLTGSISLCTWPGGLQYLHLDTNYLSGDIPTLPSTLVELRLGYPGDSIYNHFTGSLVLNQSQILFINNNSITDLVVYDPSLLAGNCDFSSNPLLGNPHISNLTMCVQNVLYKIQSQVGELFKTKYFEIRSKSVYAMNRSTLQPSIPNTLFTGN